MRFSDIFNLRDSKNLNISLFIISIILVFISMGFGYYNMGLVEVIKLFLGTSTELNGFIILSIRIPRIIAAYLIGSALSVSGAAYQGVLKNPLVSHDILGVASGAGMGAAIAIMLNLSSLYVQLFAFASGILAVFITYSLSKHVKFDSRVSLILSGVLVGSLAFSVTSMLKYLADTSDKLPEITYWLMGSLSKIDFESVLFSLPFMFIGFVTLFVMRWRLNVLTLSDAEASTMGINTKKAMFTVIAGATMLSSSAVCLGGLIGWVGLMIPHMTRSVTGPQYTKLLPASAMIGGIFVLLMDNIVRSISIMEIPIGLMIAFIGAPFFYLLISKGNRRDVF